MNSQPPLVPDEVRSATRYLHPLRDLAANVLVAATAVMLFVAIIRLIPGSGSGFGTRAQESFYSFVSLPTIVFPIAAVLLSLLVKPEHVHARLITVVALVEYAVAAAFAVLFGFLIGLIKIGSYSGRLAFEELLLRVTWMLVFAVAAYATYRIWRNLFYTPKPKPEPVYVQAHQIVPGVHPDGPSYDQPAGEQSAAHSGAHSYDALNAPTVVVPQQDQADEESPKP